MAPITYIPTFEAARMMAGGRGAGAYLPPPIWLKINGKRREGRRSPQGAFVSRYGHHSKRVKTDSDIR